MDTKRYTPEDMKLDSNGEGTFTAVFATLDAIDRDGDTYDPGVFGEQDVKISQYNHGSWKEGAAALPIGIGKIYENGNKAIISGEFDPEDDDAMKTYRKLKYFASKGHNTEWSFALPDVEWRKETRDGQEVRVLTKIKVPEVSPVLMGAGIDTELLSIKTTNKNRGVDNTDEKEDIETMSMKFVDHIDEAVETVEGLIKRAEKLKALTDEEGRPISKRSMRKLKILSDALHEAGARLDELLLDPSDELKAIALKLEEANATQTVGRETQRA